MFRLAIVKGDELRLGSGLAEAPCSAFRRNVHWQGLFLFCLFSLDTLFTKSHLGSEEEDDMEELDENHISAGGHMVPS